MGFKADIMLAWVRESLKVVHIHPTTTNLDTVYQSFHALHRGFWEHCEEIVKSNTAFERFAGNIGIIRG